MNVRPLRFFRDQEFYPNEIAPPAYGVGMYLAHTETFSFVKVSKSPVRWRIYPITAAMTAVNADQFQQYTESDMINATFLTLNDAVSALQIVLDTVDP